MSTTARRLFRLFGSSAEEAADSAGRDDVPARTSAPCSAEEQAHAQLIGEISEFLISCRLAATAYNLLIAHSAFSGEDPQLAREIARRRSAGIAIEQEWLDEQASGGNQETEVRKLIGQLEQALDRFLAAASQARKGTYESNAKLAGYVDRAVTFSGDFDLAKVLEVAQSILDQSHKLEADIRASEQETKALRKQLARAQRDAQFDYLTGLPNRRAFEVALDQHYREALGQSELLCVAFCDIDNFKVVNDRHGHETGDRILKVVAETLDRLSNQKCHVSRHGGEEFVLLFRGLSKFEVRDKLDAIRENFSARRFVNRMTDDPIGRVTFSCGVADVFAYGTARDALRAADEALYLAKEQGRNAVVIAP